MKNSKFTQLLSENSYILRDVIDSPDSILKVIHMEEEQILKCTYKEYSMLVFILEGDLSITSICAKNEYHAKKMEMLFLPQGRTFYFEANSPTQLLFCNIPPKIELFQNHPLSTYAKFIKSIPEEFQKIEICKLPVHPILMEEVEHSMKVLPYFQESKYFQMHTRETYIIYIKNLYRPEEIAFFIHPMICEDMEFLSMTLNIYHENITAQSFIEQSGMSESSFNRKFKKAFNMSLGHWLISKKREEIVEDLALTDLSIHEIAEKHFLTPNHLAKFSHAHYGMSPSELRRRLKNRHEHLLLKGD